MRVWLCLIGIFINFTLWGEDASQFEKRTGLKGTYNQAEKVFKVTFPRTDINVAVDGFTLDPFMGLTSWAAFTPIGNEQWMVMGDLVLFEDEVNPVMTSILDNHLEVTALHNHFFFDHPKVYFMHIAGVGPLETLSKGIARAMETVKQVRVQFPNIRHSFSSSNRSKENTITAKRLESIFQLSGLARDGMVKFIFGRKAKMGGIEFGQEMGINTWAAFGGSDDNAIVDGDFAVTEEELQAVLKVLRAGKINVVAIHNHMTMEQPRMIFLHFWGEGHAEDLARTIKKAILPVKS